VVPEGIHSMQATAGSATAGINVAAFNPNSNSSIRSDCVLRGNEEISRGVAPYKFSLSSYVTSCTCFEESSVILAPCLTSTFFGYARHPIITIQLVHPPPPTSSTPPSPSSTPPSNPHATGPNTYHVSSSPLMPHLSPSDNAYSKSDQ
jgi:hypothetical protein